VRAAGTNAERGVTHCATATYGVMFISRHDRHVRNDVSENTALIKKRDIFGSIVTKIVTQNPKIHVIIATLAVYCIFRLDKPVYPAKMHHIYSEEIPEIQ
jgi:hypothetical protein